MRLTLLLGLWGCFVCFTVQAQSELSEESLEDLGEEIPLPDASAAASPSSTEAAATTTEEVAAPSPNAEVRPLPPAADVKAPPKAAKETNTPADPLEQIHQEMATNGQEMTEIVDVDGDGIPEVRRFYFMKDGGRTLLRKEVDLNHDGKFDVVRIYQDSRLAQVLVDLDFDGRADTVQHYRFDEESRKDILVMKEFSFNQDGLPDVRIYYAQGKVFKRETDRNRDGAPDRFDYYQNGRLARTEFDDNGDGIVDTYGIANAKSRFPYMNGLNEKNLAPPKPPQAATAPAPASNSRQPAGKKLSPRTRQLKKSRSPFSSALPQQTLKEKRAKTSRRPAGKKMRRPNNSRPTRG